MTRPIPPSPSPEERRPPMTAERFAALAAAFGADPARWPPDLEADTSAFMLANPAASATLLDGERALDAMLAGWSVVQVPPFLDSAIAARALSHQSGLRRIRAWFTGAAAAMSLAGGLAAGIVLATTVPGTPQPGPSLYGMSVLGASFDPGQEEAGGSETGAAQPPPGGS